MEKKEEKREMRGLRQPRGLRFTHNCADPPSFFPLYTRGPAPLWPPILSLGATHVADPLVLETIEEAW